MYQFFLMISTILGPATILLSIASAFTTVFPKWDLWVCYMVALGPAIFYIGVCFKCKTSTQLAIAGLMSTGYTCVMLIVLVSIIQSATTISEINPSLVFIIVFAVAFIFAGIMHPQEIGCLTHGILYFLTIPSGYLILVVYSLTNLHVVSWGTREVAKKKTPEEEEEDRIKEEEEAKKKAKKKGILGFFSGVSILSELKELVNQVFTSRTATTQTQVLGVLSDIHEMLKILNKQLKGKDVDDPLINPQAAVVEAPVQKAIIPVKKKTKTVYTKVPQVNKSEEDRLWLSDPRFGTEKITILDKDEELFWVAFLKKYLHPIIKNVEHEKKINDDLIQLRNSVAFAFWMGNGLWVLLNYMLQADKSLRAEVFGGYKFQPIGLMFMIFFALVLFLQLAGMMKHRWGTLLQLLALTDLVPKKKDKDVQNIINFIKKFNEDNPPPEPDYLDQDSDPEESNSPGPISRPSRKMKSIKFAQSGDMEKSIADYMGKYGKEEIVREASRYVHDDFGRQESMRSRAQPSLRMRRSMRYSTSAGVRQRSTRQPTLSPESFHDTSRDSRNPHFSQDKYQQQQHSYDHTSSYRQPRSRQDYDYEYDNSGYN